MRVFVCSPYRASKTHTEVEHRLIALKLCKVVCEAGHAPFAPHLFYTQFLRDAVEAERNFGMEAGREWLRQCNELWIWDRAGASSGMRGDIAFAADMGVKIVPLDKTPRAFQDVHPDQFKMVTMEDRLESLGAESRLAVDLGLKELQEKHASLAAAARIHAVSCEASDCVICSAIATVP